MMPKITDDVTSVHKAAINLAGHLLQNGMDLKEGECPVHDYLRDCKIFLPEGAEECEDCLLWKLASSRLDDQQATTTSLTI